MKTRITQGQGWSFEPAEPVQKKRVKSSAPTGSLTPDKQNIHMNIENRSGGKVVTIIGGLILAQKEREALAQKLKIACGTGGTIHEGKIELQGDKREQVRAWFIKNGWRLKS